MKLSDLTDRINKFDRKMHKHKKLKAGQIKKVLDKLEAKQKRFKEEYAKECSAKQRKKLELKQKVAQAQIKKARKLLKNIDA